MAGALVCFSCTIKEGYLSFAVCFYDWLVRISYKHDILKSYLPIYVNCLGIGVPAEGIIIEFIETSIIASFEQICLAQISKSRAWAYNIQVFLSLKNDSHNDVWWI